jgi:hypothetical protein
MSTYKNQEFDFIQRTKSLIEQYDNLQLPKESKFEVTLLLNCMVGILILPRQQWFDQLPTELISNNKWDLDNSHISLIQEPEISVKNIVRHLRNSISHFRFKVFGNSDEETDKIKFEDFTCNGKKRSKQQFHLPSFEFL